VRRRGCRSSNLVQALRHVDETNPLREFLAHPAIRICVSAEIQQALEGLGSVEGPIFTVPIGVDLERLPPLRPRDERDIDCVVLAVKDRRLGRPVARRLEAAGYRVAARRSPHPQGRVARGDGTCAGHGAPAARARGRVPAGTGEHGARHARGLSRLCRQPLVLSRRRTPAWVPVRSEQAIAESALSALTASEHELAPMPRALAGRAWGARWPWSAPGSWRSWIASTSCGPSR